MYVFLPPRDPFVAEQDEFIVNSQRSTNKTRPTTGPLTKRTACEDANSCDCLVTQLLEWFRYFFGVSFLEKVLAASSATSLPGLP